jgi:hypothetical protein
MQIDNACYCEVLLVVIAETLGDRPQYLRIAKVGVAKAGRIEKDEFLAVYETFKRLGGFCL